MVSPLERVSDEDVVAGMALSHPAPAATTVAPDLGSTLHRHESSVARSEKMFWRLEG